MIGTLPSVTYQQASFPLPADEHFKQKAFAWMQPFTQQCWLDSNDYPRQTHPSFDWMLATDSIRLLSVQAAGNAFDQLKDFYDKNPSWLFGFLSYDLKNEVEKLESKNPDSLHFPSLHFFQPAILVQAKDEQLLIFSAGQSPKEIYQQIQETTPASMPETARLPVQIREKIPRTVYLDTIEQLRRHIIEGDIYEVNFCQEFFAEDCAIDPEQTFRRLNDLSQAPFAAFFKNQDQYLLCASPERFLKKEGQTLISQPIKGTIGRGLTPAADQILKDELLYSEKDRAENIMIVDLVRNDLARSCLPGSVQVEELFGIYPFNQVFQMISTIRGELAPEVHFIDALKEAFPMGSMTGAPKVMSMKLIEQYEQSKRGLYSGAVGYITPEGNFDFNVVIRSILYHASRRYLSFQVGGAIVYDSVPEKEYEECLLKARALLEVLGQSRDFTEKSSLPRSSQKAG